MKTVGFLKSSSYEDNIDDAGEFVEEYSLFRPHFEAYGINLEAVVWDHIEDFSRFDALIPKAVWDYYERPREFHAFLDRVEKSNTRMINPAQTVRWNMNKRYLFDLKSKGLPVLDLTFFEHGSKVDLTSVQMDTDRSKLIIKPSISGGSMDTVVTEKEDLAQHQALANKILSESDLIIQPFYEEVSQGELSFIFFGGELSHVAKKVPAKGDFRAHSYFNATNMNYQPTESEVEQAKKFVPTDCPYTRVDLIDVNGIYHLVELELIEPYLYMNYGDQKAPERFAKAIADSL